MKNLLLTLVLLGLTAIGTFAKPRSTKKVQPKQRLEQQLARYIEYPDVLKEKDREGVVVVQFRVDEEGRMSGVSVLTQDENINNSLIQQLTGKKIDVAQPGTPDTHTVRLRFHLN